jgi:hypothetical protein
LVLRSIISGILFILLAPLAAGQKSSAPDVETIVSRMIAARQRDQARMRAYMVKRDYQLLDTQEQPKAQVIASISYRPPDQNQYNIERSSGGMGGKVLRDIVQKENEAGQGASRREISPQNYEFQFLGAETVDGSNCYVLSLNPRRNEKDLIRGKLWVDAADYRIHRLEGNPAKSPSWWIRDLHILMIFASVDGMWLHTFTQAIADVRFKGKYVMESRAVQYSSETEPVTRHRSNPGMLAGAAINP